MAPILLAKVLTIKDTTYTEIFTYGFLRGQRLSEGSQLALFVPSVVRLSKLRPVTKGITIVMNLVLMLFGALIGGVVDKTHAHAADQKPNILLVVADDLGWTDLGRFGSEIDTPHLDALAHHGVTFTDFHVSVSCSPTRSMLLSGTDNHIAGLGNMAEFLTPEQRGQPGYEGYLNKSVVSLAEVLQVGGYHTYMAGKWHLGNTPEFLPHARGFERSFSVVHGGGASYWRDMHGLHEPRTTAEYTLNGKGLMTLPEDFYATRNYTDFLIDSIRENRGDGKPFFAYLAFTAPHDPLHVPEPWLSMYRGRYNEGYEVLKAKRVAGAKRMGVIADTIVAPERYRMVKAWDSLSKEQQALESRGMEVYAGMIANMDYHVSRVVKFLKDIGEYDNTLVLFLSDNGPNPWHSDQYPGNRDSPWYAQFDNSIENIGHPMSHYAYGMGWASASTGPLDLFKFTVGEGGIRSPMLIAGPGVKGGRQIDALAYVWDIMPTILEFAEVPHPKEFQDQQVQPMRGKSLKGMLNGSTTTLYSGKDFIAGESLNGKWIRRRELKAVSVAPPYGSGIWHLYHMANDPGETRDLAAEQPEVLQTLQSAWDGYAQEVGVILSK